MKQITIDDVVGKPLTRVWNVGRDMVLFFGDEWVHCHIDHGWERGDEEFEWPSLGELRAEDQYLADIIAYEELEAIEAREEAELNARQAKTERRQYERLRAKFEESV